MGQYDDAISRALARRQQGAPQALPAAEPAPPVDVSTPPAGGGSSPLGQAIGRHLGTDVVAPQVPPQRVAKPEQAESDFLAAARQNYALSTPGPEASSRAVAAANAIRARPSDIPAEPSLGREALIAFSPEQMRGDARPNTPAQTAKYIAQRGVQTATDAALWLTDPLHLNPSANRVRDAVTPDAEKGLPTENDVMWALRVFGTAVPATVQETVERIPLPDMTGAARAAYHGAFADAATRFFTPSSVGEQVLGVKPGELQQVHRDNPVSDWAEGVLERIEHGRGLEEDFAQSALNRLGPDHPYLQDAAWWLGLGVDALTDWEGSLVKAGHLATETERVARGLRTLDPELGLGESVWSALRGNYVDSDYFGNKIAAHLENGGSIDDVPAPIRARMEEVALNDRDEPLVELSERTGVGKPRTVPGEDLAHEQALEQAHNEALALMRERERAVKPQNALERPRLPEFRRPPSTAAGAWEQVGKLYAGPDVPEGGWNIPRGELFKRLLGAEDATIDRSSYVLRNFRGDVIGQGTFDEVTEKMLRRMKAELKRTGTSEGKTADVWKRNATIFRDEIWDGNTRPVVRWSRAGRMRLSTDFFFASPVEERLVSHLRSSDLRALPGRFLAAERVKARRAGQVAGELLADATTGAPAGRAPLSEVGQVAVEATRLALRDLMGSHEFKQLPNMAFVAKGDHARLLDQAGQILGVTPDRARALIGGATTTADEEAKLSALARRAGVQRQPGTLTTKGWTLLRRAALEQAGGALADVRYRVRGTQPWIDRAWQALADAHLDRRKYSKTAGAVLKNGPLSWISKRFLEDKFAGLPSPVQVLLKEARVRLERVPDDVLADFKALPKDLSPAAKIQQLIGRYSMVHPDELAMAQIQKMSVPELDELRRTWRGERPSWLDSADPLVNTSGFRGWSRGVRDAAADAGRAWVRSHLFAAGVDVNRTVVGDLLHTQIPEELAIKVWRETFEQGNLAGPALKEALAAVNYPALKIDEHGALVAHVLQLRAESVIAEEVDKLMGLGAVVRSNDVRKPALHAVMVGEHRRWNPALKRWEYNYPEAAVTWALQKARDWGIDPGSEAALSEARLGGHNVVLPKYLADDLQRMIGSATIDSRGIYKNEVLNTLLRYFKEWTTHGVIMPNPAFFTGQMLSLAPTMIATRGLRGTAEAAGTLLRHPQVVGELLMRLAGGESPTFAGRAAERWTLRTATGELLSMDDLEREARLGGLQDTRTGYEMAERLKDVVVRDGAPYGLLDPRRIGGGLKWWQNNIRMFAGAYDEVARLSVFVSEVEKGVPPAVAAQTARAAALDFRDLTEWEAKYLRKIFTFYAFLRKNSDAYIKALVHNPSRVLGQMRLAQAGFGRGGLSKIEQGSVNPDDMGRLVVYDDDHVVAPNGRPNPLYRLDRLTTTPMGVPEWMNTVRIFGGFGDPDAQGIAQQLSPIGQTLAILLMGRKLDRDFDSPYNNRIPPALMDSFLSPVLMKAFGVGPVALRETDDQLTADDDATRELGSGVGAVWAAGGDRSLTPEQAAHARDAWQAFLTWFGRPIGTLEQMAEGAAGIPGVKRAVDALPTIAGWDPSKMLEPPPPYMTQSESTLAALTGLKWRPVLTGTEAVRRAEQAREYRFRAAQDAITLPGHRRSR